MSDNEKQNENIQNRIPLLENFHFHSAPELDDVSFQFHQTKRDGPSIDINIPRVNAANATIRIDDRQERIPHRQIQNEIHRQIEELDEISIEKALSMHTCCFIFIFVMLTINIVFTLILFFKEVTK